MTGCLPIALDRATRVVQTLLPAGKEYVCLMYLHKEVGVDKIKKTFEKFSGEITQLPPVRSAVKRQERKRKIYYTKILEIDGQHVLFKIGCEAGTYIRKLCLHPKTEILTREGLLPASDFYSNHPKVYSFSKDMMIEKNPSATQKILSPSKLIKIMMDSGIDFIVTPDHKMLTSKKEGYKMIEARILKDGDYLVKSLIFPDSSKDLVIADLLDDEFYVQQDEIKEKCKQAFISKYGSIRAMYRKLRLDRKSFLLKSNYAITIRHLKLAGIYDQVKRKINTFKTQKGIIIKVNRLNEDFFYLLGLIASDGNNTREKRTVRNTRVKFHNNNEELVNRFLKIYKKLFPDVPISKKKMTPALFQLDTTNSFLATIAASLGVKSPQKHSDLLAIVNVKSVLIKSFLKGFFDGDGSAYYKKKSNVKSHHSYIRFHTVSYNDAKRLHQMLLKINIPNRIFLRKMHNKKLLQGIKYKYHYVYDVSIGSLAAEKKFIQEIGSNHPFKISKFKQILSIKGNSGVDDHQHIGFHYKGEVRKNKSKLSSMGGNLPRILKNNVPMTKGFYKKASIIVRLPEIDDFIIEKIKSIEFVKGTDYVYDMTVPETHNFLIETGFVSSNCHDFGKKLDTNGHMAQLVRTKAGPFSEDSLTSLHDLHDAYSLWKEGDENTIKKIIFPFENAVGHLGKIWVADGAVDPLCHGADLYAVGVVQLDDSIQKGDLVAVFTLKNELICIGNADLDGEEILKSEKGIAVKTSKVFMHRGIYKL